jgi:hypothetical protein
MGDNSTHVVRDEDFEDAAEERPRCFAAVDHRGQGLRERQPHEHVPRIHRGEDQRMGHPTPAGRGVQQHPHPGEVDLAFHPRLAVDHGHRPGPSAALIVGAFLAVAVQCPLRHEHALAGQQITDLDHRQTIFDPLTDAIMVGAQHFPRRPKPLGAVRAHHRHHRADQLVIDLLITTGPVQARGHRSLDIPTRGLAVHPSPGGHRPQPVTGQPRSKNLTNLDHRNLPKHRRTPSRDFDVKRSDPVIERPPTRHAGGPITGNQVVP